MAAVILSAGAARAEPRPVAAVFQGGGCADAACAQGRFKAFLDARGLAELTTGERALRYFRLDPAPDCAADAPDQTGVEMRRYDLPADGRVLVAASVCGVSTISEMPPERARELRAALNQPAFAGFGGAFPSYCPESAEDEPAAHFIEVVQDGAYNLIEWECEVPLPLAPVLAALGLEQD